ncbi:MAG: hypothetical protein V3V28_09050 [Polaribacter sp.]|uniref:hypothetical protein n=1 Tax=Polaribacter sp. TaxID=1920175 RepID=UPI002F3597A2
MNSISKTYNKDCMIDLPSYEDNHFDYAFVDPNWGIKETSINPDCRNRPVTQKNGKKLSISSKNYSTSNWDVTKPTKEYFKELFRISKFQIIKGGNHFTQLLPDVSSGRIIWDKVNGTNDFSDCEIFWTNIFSSVRLFSYMWNGMFQGESLLEPKKPQGNKKLYEKRIHRSQTPVKVYDWFYKNIIPVGSTIIDTHLGSGSNRISAYKSQCDFTGYEIGKKEYLDQEIRFKNIKPDLDSALLFHNQTNQEFSQTKLI